MNFLIKHAGAAFGGAIVPPAIYFLVINVTPVASIFVPPPSPTPTQTIALRPTQTAAPTPSPNPTPHPTNTPTPKPTSKPTPSPNPLTATPTSMPTQTPTPPTTPSQTSATSTQLDEWFTKYSNEYSIDRGQLWNIAACESGLNPNAKNGDYGGLFQFAGATWTSTRKAMNADTNADLRFNPEEAIKTASFKISSSGTAAWRNCL